eukprot:TRINITY_DN8671_c0_g1_i2.p1 TRINITY_DN8671_c0_g1~~TRINITY_DN8671_c0_g1_i2.p1  ORF type:complete len:245 (-),score=22.74 TRINITY_DN8671_c0_g1_i2:164-898(-)
MHLALCQTLRSTWPLGRWLVLPACAALALVLLTISTLTSTRKPNDADMKRSTAKTAHASAPCRLSSMVGDGKVERYYADMRCCRYTRERRPQTALPARHANSCGSSAPSGQTARAAAQLSDARCSALIRRRPHVASGAASEPSEVVSAVTPDWRQAAARGAVRAALARRAHCHSRLASGWRGVRIVTCDWRQAGEACAVSLPTPLAAGEACALSLAIGVRLRRVAVRAALAARQRLRLFDFHAD